MSRKAKDKTTVLKEETLDTISAEVSARNSKKIRKERKGTSGHEGSDPSIFTLWNEAVRRNAELKHRLEARTRDMTDIEQKKNENVSSKESIARAHAQQRTKREENTRDRKNNRQSNTTDYKKQLEQEELKHVNGLSQMSSDKRFPPQPNTRSVVYFQNRFIILDTADRNTGSTNSTINTDKQHDDIKEVRARKMDAMETSFSKINSTSDSKNKNNAKVIEMDASSVTMDARGIDIILTDPDNSSKQIKNADSFNAEEYKKKNTIWRKINRVLLDDRVKASNGQIILETRHPEEYRILKKVLNILFLTIGITLFVSVIIVVIYAFIVGDDKKDSLTNTATTTLKPS